MEKRKTLELEKVGGGIEEESDWSKKRSGVGLKKVMVREKKHLRYLVVQVVVVVYNSGRESRKRERKRG